MNKILIAIGLVLVASVSEAQGVIGHNFRVYNIGAAQPLQAPIYMLHSSFMCNTLPPPVLGSPVTNPTKVVYEDPANANMSCFYQDPGNGPLFSVPIGVSLEATLTNINDAGESVESNRTLPFMKVGVPGPPTGFRLSK